MVQIDIITEEDAPAIHDGRTLLLTNSVTLNGVGGLLEARLAQACDPATSMPVFEVCGTNSSLLLFNRCWGHVVEIPVGDPAAGEEEEGEVSRVHLVSAFRPPPTSLEDFHARFPIPNMVFLPGFGGRETPDGPPLPLYIDKETRNLLAAEVPGETGCFANLYGGGAVAFEIEAFSADLIRAPPPSNAEEEDEGEVLGTIVEVDPVKITDGAELGVIFTRIIVRAKDAYASIFPSTPEDGVGGLEASLASLQVGGPT